jgi:NADH:ubiquinone oxidoreductase subunit 4 (subunit M)
MFPFHSWLLNAHVEANAGASMILAGVLLKIGYYGFFRFIIVMMPVDDSLVFAPYVACLALFSVFFASICMLGENDIKRIIALSSIAHMNVSILGLFTLGKYGKIGSLLLGLGHGFTSAALFFLAGVLYRRFHTRDVRYFGGLVSLMPISSGFFFCFVALNSGFPASLNF